MDILFWEVPIVPYCNGCHIARPKVKKPTKIEKKQFFYTAMVVTLNCNKGGKNIIS
jgi:hypothetical protein